MLFVVVYLMLTLSIIIFAVEVQQKKQNKWDY